MDGIEDGVCTTLRVNKVIAMCGIVGLFIKDQALEPDLGHLMAGMLATMRDRGPDSAGFAVYGSGSDEVVKITVQSADPDRDFAGLASALGASLGKPVGFIRHSTHAVLRVPADLHERTREVLKDEHPNLRVMGAGQFMEIFKEVGDPSDVAERFGLVSMSGSHGVGHTRMATESAVTTLGAHPFSTGSDQCLVHNGSLSNHNNLRRDLQREGIRFETDNDSEVAAAYLTSRMSHGLNLGQALDESLNDLDGFFTFVVGTKNGFGIARDPIACKPAVLAETDRYVAFGTEYRALAGLPGIKAAKVWEAEPATVYFWGR